MTLCFPLFDFFQFSFYFRGLRYVPLGLPKWGLSGGYLRCATRRSIFFSCALDSFTPVWLFHMFSHLGLVLSHVSFTPVHVVYIYEHVRDLESPDQYPDCGLQVSSCFPSIEISTLTVDFSVLAVCALLLDSTDYVSRNHRMNGFGMAPSSTWIASA